MNITPNIEINKPYRHIFDLLESHDDSTINELCDKISSIKDQAISFHLIDSSLSFAKSKVQYDPCSLTKIKNCFLSTFEKDLIESEFLIQVDIAYQKGQLYEFICLQIHHGSSSEVSDNISNIDWGRLKESDRIELFKTFILSNTECAITFAEKFEHTGLHNAPLACRLELCDLIVSQGDFAARSLARNLDKFNIQGASLTERMKLFEAIASMSYWTLITLTDHIYWFAFQQLTAQECFKLCTTITSKGFEYASDSFARNFNILWLENVDSKDRLEICKLISLTGQISAQSVVNNSNNFGIEELTLEELIPLFDIIASQGSGALQTLVMKLDKFTLPDANWEGRLQLYDRLSSLENLDVQTRVTMDYYLINFFPNTLRLSDRLKLCQHLATYSASIAKALSKTFDHFNLGAANVWERLAVCEKIAEWNEDTARSVAVNFDKFELTKANPTDLLRLCDSIISRGESAASALVVYFDACVFEKMDPLDRLNLCKKILISGEQGAMSLARKIDSFSLLDVELDDRIDICVDIVQQGESHARIVAENYEKFFLNVALPADHLKICHLIASQGENAAVALVKNFYKFDLQGILPTEIETLGRLIILQGDWAAKTVVENFDELGLINMPLEVRKEICHAIAEKGEASAKALATNFAYLRLREADPLYRVCLCLCIVTQGDRAVEALSNHANSFGLEHAEPAHVLSLLESIASYGYGSASHLTSSTPFSELLQKRTFLERLNICKIIISHTPFLIAKGYMNLGVTINDIEEMLITYPGHVTDHESNVMLRQHEKISRQAWVEYLALEPVADEVVERESRDVLPPEVCAVIQNKGIISDYDEQALFCYLQKNKKYNSLSKFSEGTRQTINPLTKSSLIAWLAYAAAIIDDLSEKEVELIDSTNLLELIYNYQSPNDRYSLMRNLSFMPKGCPEDLLCHKTNHKSWTQLASILLSRLTKWGMTREQKDKLLGAINRQNGFKDTQKSKILFQFLLSLITHEPYSKEQIDVIVEVALEALSKHKKEHIARQRSDIENAIQALTWFSNILQLFGKQEFLSTIQDPEKFFSWKFQGLFAIEDAEADITKQYDSTFATFRNPAALFTYLRSIKQLPEKEMKPVFEALSKYVTSVLNGAFPSIRYRTDDNPHLHKIFENREGLREAWSQNVRPEKAVFSSSGKEESLDYVAFFREKIIQDKHLDPKNLPLLLGYLTGADANTTAHDVGPYEQLESLMVQLCEGTLEVNNFIKQIKTLKVDLGEFKNDLKALLPKESLSEYTISESDDACDLLLIGTEVNGSCQRVNGDPRNTKCLVGYLIGGEVRAIVVKDRDKKIVARSLLRLMWDGENETPVLLLERTYSNVSDNNVKDAICVWAKERATELNLPLVSKDVGTGDPYLGTVAYLGGNAPFVYTDAGRGSYEGPFQIVGCHLVL